MKLQICKDRPLEKRKNTLIVTRVLHGVGYLRGGCENPHCFVCGLNLLWDGCGAGVG